MRAIVLLLLLTSVVHAEPESYQIQRAGTPTIDEVARVLAAAEWTQLNPEKKTSTWDSQTYVFGKTEVAVARHDLVRPTTTTYA